MIKSYLPPALCVPALFDIILAAAQQHEHQHDDRHEQQSLVALNPSLGAAISEANTSTPRMRYAWPLGLPSMAHSAFSDATVEHLERADDEALAVPSTMLWGDPILVLSTRVHSQFVRRWALNGGTTGVFLA